MRKLIIESLEKMKKEVEKRNGIYEHGIIDLVNYEVNYENLYTVVCLDLLCHSLFLMNKKTLRTEDMLRKEVEWWLWEDVEKYYKIGKVTYKVEKASDFVKFLLEK